MTNETNLDIIELSETHKILMFVHGMLTKADFIITAQELEKAINHVNNVKASLQFGTKREILDEQALGTS